MADTDQLPIPPYGGDDLVDLVVSIDRAAELKKASHGWLSWDLTTRQLCDLEMLTTGAYTPLVGFLEEDDYLTVLQDMRLADGTLWPMPITLDVTEDFAEHLSVGAQIALRDPEGTMLAALHVRSIYQPDPEEEARAVYGTADRAHPDVDRLLRGARPVYLGGAIEALQLPNQYDFTALRRTPFEVRRSLQMAGLPGRVVGLHTRSVLHRALDHLACSVFENGDAQLLVMSPAGDDDLDGIDHFTRFRTYLDVMATWDAGTAQIVACPEALRFAGPREALLHAIEQRNFGANEVMIGPDHASPGASVVRDFYPPYAAADLVKQHAAELRIEVATPRRLVHVDGRGPVPDDEVGEDEDAHEISGEEIRLRLERGEDLPDWLVSPSVAKELARTYPARHQRGFTVFFTGLSGSGKSTVANVLTTRIREVGGRSVTLLDGDLVRKHLSSELGFSREDRNTNVLRIGYVASEITKHGGIAICAPIAPYDRIRKQNRQAIQATGGGYVLVHVSTPQEVCEQRDRKGLYAKARAGMIQGFTGVDDPYEPPDDADLDIDTSEVTAPEAADQIVRYLVEQGWLPENFLQV